MARSACPTTSGQEVEHVTAHLGMRERKANVEKEIINIIHSFIKKERDLWKKDSWRLLPASSLV